MGARLRQPARMFGAMGFELHGLGIRLLAPFMGAKPLLLPARLCLLTALG